MKKPVRLEINTAGAWKVIAKFDSANDEASDDVLYAAGNLAVALQSAGSGCALRVSMAEAPHSALMYWDDQWEGWREAKGGTA